MQRIDPEWVEEECFVFAKSIAWKPAALVEKTRITACDPVDRGATVPGETDECVLVQQLVLSDALQFIAPVH
jgi:hypothetical protein